MNNFKFTLLANIIIETTFTVCVTLAAIHFNRASILGWLLLLVFMGYTYKSGGEQDA